MFSDHNKLLKLEINNRKIFGSSENILKLKNTLLNNPWIQEEVSREIRKYFELNENKNYNISKFVECN